MWKNYNIYFIWNNKKSEKISVTALDKDDALLDPKAQRIIAAGAYPYKIIKVSIHPSTPKQKLAQKYGFIMGGIKGTQRQFESVIYDYLPDNNEQISSKMFKAQGLVYAQFAKLQRDIRDLFKLAGLKVK